jgi:YHS domain-containing protein
MGEDIVLMVERNKRVEGNRKFGAWFQGRVFLFSNQETLNVFADRPEYYLEIALKYEMARREQPVPVVY